MSSVATLCDSFLASSRAGDASSAEQAIVKLRKEVLFSGIQEPAEVGDSRLTLRGKVWKALIGLDHVSAQEYIDLIAKGTSIKYDKIRGDSFRTFPDEKIFTERVPEPSIIRLLNSFTHAYTTEDSPFSYRQGMNAIAAPLLWCMPEMDAYFAFEKLITEKFPLYWTNDVVGGEAGCKLVDTVLALVDPQLSNHLTNASPSQPLTAYIYAFSCVSSLSSSVPPFEELIHLWDFLLAFGLHLNILCVVAQVILMRDKLLATTAPKTLLDYRKWPPLRARVIISVVMSILPRIPSKLFEKICKHATDPKVCSELVGRPVNFTWKPKRV